MSHLVIYSADMQGCVTTGIVSIHISTIEQQMFEMCNHSTAADLGITNIKITDNIGIKSYLY